MYIQQRLRSPHATEQRTSFVLSKFTTLPLRPPLLASVLLAVPSGIQYLQLGAVARPLYAPPTRAHRPLLDAASWASNDLGDIF